MLVIALAPSGCSRDLRARVVDASGHPIPGAVFYAEAVSGGQAFDFAFSVAGANGEVPPAGTPRLTISWRPGARLALAAFAPGKKALALYDPLGRLEADGIELQLEDLKTGIRGWAYRVAELSYPFESSPGLAARAAAPACAPLRRAFRAAYAPLVALEATAGERAKLRAVERLGP